VLPKRQRRRTSLSSCPGGSFPPPLSAGTFGFWGTGDVREQKCVHISVRNRWDRVWNRSPHLTKVCQPADVGVEGVSELGGTLCPAGQPGKNNLAGHTLAISDQGPSVHPSHLQNR
jgi:hypothetical protein